MTNIERKMQERINAGFKTATDTGNIGKCFELAIREFLAMNEKGHTRYAHKVASQGKADCRFSWIEDEKRIQQTVEIKTACGEIDYADRCQIIIYCPEVDITVPAEQQGYVFTREEWQDFLVSYPGRGAFTKVDSRGKTHIQSFRSKGRPKASQPIRNYIDEYLEYLPTVEEWKAELRGY